MTGEGVQPAAPPSCRDHHGLPATPLGSWSPMAVCMRATHTVKAGTVLMFARLYLNETFLKGLAQDLQDVLGALRQLIEKDHAVVGQHHLPRQLHLRPSNQPHSR
jgi:hypothetical protein